MNRLLKPRRESESTKPLDDVTTSGDRGSSRGGLRKALAGLAVAGLAYVAARRLRRSGGAPSMGEVKETVGDVRSGEGLDIPIGERGDASGDEETDETGASGSGTTEGAIGNEPMPGEDISDTAIDQRAEEDAHEEPKEPGEMTVDEEIAEGVTGGDDEADEADAETDDAEADETDEVEAGDSDEEAATERSDDEESA